MPNIFKPLRRHGLSARALLTAAAIVSAGWAETVSACRSPMSERYVLLTEAPQSEPGGTVTLSITVDPLTLRKNDVPIIANIIAGSKTNRILKIWPSRWTSCSWWAGETRLFWAGKRGGPYIVSGYVYRDRNGDMLLDPVQFGRDGRMHDPGRFATDAAYLDQLRR